VRQDLGRTIRHRTGALAAALACVAGLAVAVAGSAGATPASPTSTATSSSAPASPTADAMRIVARMQPSWNLGNTLDAIPDETSWGNPKVTKQLFDTIRAQGFRSVRIPVTWSGHQSATAPYTIDAAWMARVRQVVDWALADGLRVDLNVHHDSWQWITNMPSDHDNVLARFDADWTQIAAEFKDEPADQVLFESVNEPGFTNATDAQKQADLDELNTSFHTIVRASGGNNAKRLLVLPTIGCTPDATLMNSLAAEMASLNDPNLVATVHYYSYWPFSVNIAGVTTFDTTTQNDLLGAFQRMHDIFVAKGIPVYLGEYGTLAYDPNQPEAVEHGEMLKYYELLGYEARINGVTDALWDPYSMLDRTTFQWRDPQLNALIQASWHTRSATMSSDDVFLSKAGPITDQTLTLNLNGTTFKRLMAGTTPLVNGTDYTVSGNRLTLKAAALTRLAGTRSYGVNATLQAEFGRGVPWQINVISYDTPTQSAASGTGTSLDIPTQFHGDQLATMEGTYADGSNAGSASWTPFQEFGTAFEPDYANNVITMKPDFVNALKDGVPATLTFHFWSGAVITYHVTKSGTSLTGSVS
jgi:endoglucanase